MDTVASPDIVIDGQLRRDTVLWRYLDAAKLFDFFANSTLFFCRADRFSDKFEGAFTPTLRQQISDSYARGEIDYTYEQFKRRMRESVFINCWHRSQDDSAAMWALYGSRRCATASRRRCDARSWRPIRFRGRGPAHDRRQACMRGYS
ncbi:hypothetical protein [Massilia sp. 9096]|uniref:hypothetical protein n=1 Tax=Massilia sp. 9096 TaxID=1500894 RepID=UPI0012E07FDD|nr:hypothetical protein [Massilia sp. 9096]